MAKPKSNERDKTLNKLKLVPRLYKRVDGQISNVKIRDVIMYITAYISRELEEKRSVSIDNFGTFSVAQEFKIGVSDKPYLVAKFAQADIVNKILKEKKIGKDS
jgi:hypothetical protein